MMIILYAKRCSGAVWLVMTYLLYEKVNAVKVYSDMAFERKKSKKKKDSPIQQWAYL